jgi:hypothetical protein
MCCCEPLPEWMPQQSSMQLKRGRPSTPAEIRDLIREMSIANPLWGAPRIHGRGRAKILLVWSPQGKILFAQLRQQLTTGRHVERAHMEGRVLVGRCKPGCERNAERPLYRAVICHLLIAAVLALSLYYTSNVTPACGRVLWGTEVLALRSTVGALQGRSLPKAISARTQRTDGRARLSISLDEAVAPCSFQCAAHSSRLFH